jgi:hypothetical protein
METRVLEKYTVSVFRVKKRGSIIPQSYGKHTNLSD